MVSRADVERMILEEEEFLERVAHLLEHKVDLAAWPDEARAALALALDDPSMSRTEGWKAVTLRRHLFGPSTFVPVEFAALAREPTVADRARAARLRAGLSARVRYRIAAYLVGKVASTTPQ